MQKERYSMKNDVKKTSFLLAGKDVRLSNTRLEKFWRILLYLTGDVIAKLYVTKFSTISIYLMKL